MLDSFHKAFFISGASYIFTHTGLSFHTAGMDVTVFHNFCNGIPFGLARVSQMTFKKLKLVQASNIQERAAFGTDLFPGYCSKDMHLVVLKPPGEPVQNSLADDDNNLACSFNLLQFF